MKFLCASITGLLLASCSSTADLTREYGPGAFTLIGTMARLPIEGGCWQFRSDDGATYQVSGGEAGLLHKEGQRAQIVVREVRESRTICVTGKTIQLLKITRLY